jgi:hypothetical protein
MAIFKLFHPDACIDNIGFDRITCFNIETCVKTHIVLDTVLGQVTVGACT